MSFDNDNDSDPTTTNNDSLRSKLSRRGFLGVCAAAAAAAPVAKEKAQGKGKGLGETPPGQEDDNDEDEEEDDEEEEEDEEEEDLPDPVSNVVFEDKVIEGGQTKIGPVEKWDQTRKGYLSLHDYDRFDVADDVDDFDEEVERVAEEMDDVDADIEVEPPNDLEYPVCESMVGITERFDPGEYEDVEVPLLRADIPAIGRGTPAVDLGPREAGPMTSSEVLICIPHFDSTGDEEFHCPDDPNTPKLDEEDGELIDGAYGEGDRAVEDIGVSHDLGVLFIEDDDEETQAKEAIKKRLIEDGVLEPQAFNPESLLDADGEDGSEDDADDGGDEDEDKGKGKDKDKDD